MESKERFLTAMHHGQPDRIPLFDFLFTKELFADVIGRKSETYNPEDAVECTLKMGLDAAWIPSDGFAGYTPTVLSENTYIDEWGTTYCSNGTSWPIDPPIAYPVKNWEDFKNMTWPDPNDSNRTSSVRKAMKIANGKIAILGGVEGPFTRLFFLMGLENACITAYEEPELFHAVMRKATDYNLKAGLRLIETGVDAIVVSEDLGYNSGTFLSPKMTRNMMLPYIREMTTAFKKAGATIMLHCDGNMNAMMDDIAALGIDAWQPLERKSGNDIGKVKKNYGKNLTLVGNVDSSVTLPFGTKDDVVKQTLECIRLAGPGGGYILGSDHSLHDGIPVANIYTMFETAKEYGTYPLRLNEFPY